MRRFLLQVLACATLLGVAFLTHAAAAVWNQAPNVRQLYEAAKREGKVIIWGTHRREVDWIAAAFGKLFPGIEVEYLGDNDIAVKAIAEARAGRHQVDVYWHSMTGHLPVVQRDLLAPNDWPIFAVDPRNTAFDGRMGLTSNIVYAIAYNTKAVTAAEVPTTWAGAVDERFKGKATGSSFLLPRLVGARAGVGRRDGARLRARPA